MVDKYITLQTTPPVPECETGGQMKGMKQPKKPERHEAILQDIST